MNELLNLGQRLKIIPQDFQYANRGTIISILKESIVIKLEAPPTGLKVRQLIEFYSPTKFGTLFFSSAVVKVDEDKLVVLKPLKHRFLQRRTFTRIKFAEKINLKQGNNTIETQAVDLAAGGIKVTSKSPVALDDIYEVEFAFSGGLENIKCKFSPVLVQRSEEGVYTAAGKFIDLPYDDRMRIIQYCLRKDIEYNRK